MKNEHADSRFNEIEAFLFGRMNAADQAAFEAEMGRNPGLAVEVGLHRLEHQAIELAIQSDLRSQLSAWKAEDEAAQAASQNGGKTVSLGSARPAWMRYAIAACITLLVGFFAKSWFFPGETNDELANRYMDGTFSEMRGSDPDDQPDVLSPALLAMNLKTEAGYLAAADLLVQVRDSAWQTNTWLLLGECKFRLRDYPAAVAAFQQVLDYSASRSKRDEAEWLMLLTRLAHGDKKEALKPALEKISGDPIHRFQKNAGNLKKDW